MKDAGGSKQTVKNLEAMKLALEALSVWQIMQSNNITAGAVRLPAMAALRQAIQQGPPVWVGLSRAEFLQAISGLEDKIDIWIEIEMRLKEKNL